MSLQPFNACSHLLRVSKNPIRKIRHGTWDLGGGCMGYAWISPSYETQSEGIAQLLYVVVAHMVWEETVSC